MIVRPPYFRVKKPWSVKPGPGSEIDYSHPIPRDITGCWLLNEAAGGIAFDLVRQNHGTLTNGPLWVGGKYGSALNFDGSNDYVDCGKIDAVNLATELSGVAWVKPTTDTTDDMVIANSDASNGFFLARDDVGSGSGRTDIYAVFILESTGSGNARVEGATNSGIANEYKQVAFTYRENTASNGLRLFINGVEDPNSPSSTSGIIGIDSGLNTRIGANGAGGSLFAGIIEHCVLWNRVLAPSEIAELYHNPFVFIRPPAQRLYFFGTTGGAPTQNATAGIAVVTVTARDAVASPGAVTGSAAVSVVTVTPLNPTATPGAVTGSAGIATVTVTPLNPTATPGAVTASPGIAIVNVTPIGPATIYDQTATSGVATVSVTPLDAVAAGVEPQTALAQIATVSVIGLRSTGVLGAECIRLAACSPRDFSYSTATAPTAADTANCIRLSGCNPSDFNYET